MSIPEFNTTFNSTSPYTSLDSAPVRVPITTQLPTWGDAPTTVMALGQGVLTDDDEKATDHPTMSVADRLVQGRLDDLGGGWSAEEVEEWVRQEYLEPISVTDLSTDTLARYIDWLLERLDELGYQAGTRKHYEKLWKTLAKEHLAERQTTKKAASAEAECNGQLPVRFSVCQRTMPGTTPMATDALYDERESEFLTNFALTLDEEVKISDEFEMRMEFHGHISMFGKTIDFKIDAKDYADSNKLRAAITVAAGADAVIHCKMDRLREAISTISWQPGNGKVCRTVTRDFGWTESGDAFLVPGGTITAEGFVPVTDQSALRLDLSEEETARALDLVPAKSPGELQRLKEHIVTDLLPLHDRRVTYSLLGAVGAAVLGRFAPETAPFAL